MSPTRSFKYDAAISFLNDDLGLAQQIRDGLAPVLSVFLYADRQQEIAGGDGLAIFRSAFRFDARLVIVLFRSQWGQTPWTRVEQHAVEERFLKEGPEFLFFMMLDKTSTPPPWLHEHLMRFSLPEYSIEQAIGAIKFRLQEIGAKFHKESIVERAARTEELARFNEETRILWKTSEGVIQATKAAEALVDQIEKTFRELVETVPGLRLEVGREHTHIVARTATKQSVEVAWVNNVINVLDDAYLGIWVFQSRIILPGEKNRYYPGGPPKSSQEHRFQPERVRGLDWCWKAGDDSIKTSTELAEYVVRLLLDELERKRDLRG